jgi:hypothetical protein
MARVESEGRNNHWDLAISIPPFEIWSWPATHPPQRIFPDRAVQMGIRSYSLAIHAYTIPASNSHGHGPACVEIHFSLDPLLSLLQTTANNIYIHVWSTCYQMHACLHRCR